MQEPSTNSPTNTSINASLLTFREYEAWILTHQLVPAGPIPTAMDSFGVYPYESYCETSNRPSPRKYTFITIENKHLSATICPSLGGKVTSLVHKSSCKEVLYVPEVIRPTRILPRFYFVPGGIQVSFPISHSPTQNEHVQWSIDEHSGRLYVACGERELRFGMQWTVEYSLAADDQFLTQRMVLYNPSSSAHPWMCWSNAALPASPDTIFDFPHGKVLVHSSKLETIDWKDQGPKNEADVKEMTGYFWQSTDVNSFGAFTPSLGCGLYHTAEASSAPGVKLWTYGQEKHWATLGSAKMQPYIEIQGGPIRDQSIKLQLQPGEKRSHTEFWLPTDQRLDIHALSVPLSVLRPLSSVPCFDWARLEAVRPWLQLIDAYKEKHASPPTPPAVQSCCWPPSAMDELDAPFQWAIEVSQHSYRFYYGCWLAGRDDLPAAVRQLTASQCGVAKVLLSRLLRSKGDFEGAQRALEAVMEPWLQMHPQTIIERDKVLRHIGTPASLLKREEWLNRVEALPDEWLIERRVQLFIDQGKHEQAKQVLLSTHFQHVHQTYTRTALWKQICEALKLPFEPIPTSLGEDRLASFGAYREYD